MSSTPTSLATLLYGEIPIAVSLECIELTESKIVLQYNAPLPVATDVKIALESDGGGFTGEGRVVSVKEMAHKGDQGHMTVAWTSVDHDMLSTLVCGVSGGSSSTPSCLPDPEGGGGSGAESEPSPKTEVEESAEPEPQRHEEAARMEEGEADPSPDGAAPEPTCEGAIEAESGAEEELGDAPEGVADPAVAVDQKAELDLDAKGDVTPPPMTDSGLQHEEGESAGEEDALDATDEHGSEGELERAPLPDPESELERAPLPEPQGELEQLSLPAPEDDAEPEGEAKPKRRRRKKAATEEGTAKPKRRRRRKKKTTDV